MTITLLDDSWLAMPACELFEDLGAALPDHAERALGSVQDAETQLQTLADNLLYPPFRQEHAHELEALFERRRELPTIIARRMAHWENVERGVVEPRVWPTRRRGDPVLGEQVFALGDSRVIVRWEATLHVGRLGFRSEWSTSSRLVLDDGRELTVNGPFSRDHFIGMSTSVVHLGGARYQVRANNATKVREFVFDLDGPSITYVTS